MSQEIARTVLQFIALLLPALIIFIQLSSSSEISMDRIEGQRVVKTGLQAVGLFSIVGLLAVIELVRANSSDGYDLVLLAVVGSGLLWFLLMLWRYWKYYEFRFQEGGVDDS